MDRKFLCFYSPLFACYTESAFITDDATASVFNGQLYFNQKEIVRMDWAIELRNSLIPIQPLPPYYNSVIVDNGHVIVDGRQIYPPLNHLQVRTPNHVVDEVI